MLIRFDEEGKFCCVFLSEKTDLIISFHGFCLFVCLFVVVVFDNLLLRLTSNFLAIFDSAFEKGGKRVLEKAK